MLPPACRPPSTLRIIYAILGGRTVHLLLAKWVIVVLWVHESKAVQLQHRTPSKGNSTGFANWDTYRIPAAILMSLIVH